MGFDNTFSSQIKPNNDADFWLAKRLTNGESQCILVGKYLRSSENLYRFEG